MVPSGGGAPFTPMVTAKAASSAKVAPTISISYGPEIWSPRILSESDP